VIEIANVATNGSRITESLKDGHVTYDVYEYQQTQAGYCALYDLSGQCINYVDAQYDWVLTGSDATGAKIIGTVSSNTKMKLNGTSVAKVGDETNETWIAYPSVPPDTASTQYRNVSPGTSGSGKGSITEGNNKNAKVNGKLIAVVGSEVTTHLGNTTTIADGKSQIQI
jgi:uncharacterized Zn-binding protein involved in type VI secretion